MRSDNVAPTFKESNADAKRLESLVHDNLRLIQGDDARSSTSAPTSSRDLGCKNMQRLQGMFLKEF